MTFRWRHPRKSLAACRRRLLLDLGGRTLLDVRRLHVRRPCGGWGVPVESVEFVRWLASWSEVAA